MIGSLLFDISFYSLTTLLCLASPLFYLSGQGFWARYAWLWSWVSLWLMKIFLQLTYEKRGEHNIPTGSFIYAVKHQSAWETFTCHVLFFNLCIIFKYELTHIPLFGKILKKLKMIGIKRDNGRQSMKTLIIEAKERLSEGRPLLIFPEGKRVDPEEETKVQAGIVALYTVLKVPVVPVALNSGVYWPRRAFFKKSGKIIVEFLEPIPIGLSKEAFRDQLEKKLTLATHRLVKEAKK